MARSVAWRRQASDAASWHQDEALNATIYILREMGPTGFLLKEEGESKKFKVYLGDPHSCTCPTFLKEKDLCKHICWVILKKFRVPRQNQITWQLGLVEREINEILKGIAASRAANPSAAARRLAKSAPSGDGDVEESEDQPGSIKQKPISEEDVCPICQDEFFAKHLPVTYCKFGCGNNIHIKCMKVWADHQKTQGETVIKCPLCREDFGPFSLLQEEMRNTSTRNTKAERLGQHLATTCKKCRVSPIVGKCYKCTVCAEYHLCQNCFITPVHGEHNFEFRERPNQRWQAAQRGTGSVLPSALVNAMMNRDLGDQDYEMLLQLDSQAAQAASDLSQETVQSFPVERVRKNGLLLAPGQQCLVCLQCYSEGQFVRKLPCKHKFHRECIDNWLLHQHATCPVDGTVYTNDSVKAFREAQKIRLRERQANQQPRDAQVARHQQNGLVLEVPGLGISIRGNRPTGTLGMLRHGHLGAPQTQGNVQDTGIAISGIRLAGGADASPHTSVSPSDGSSQVVTSPMYPVPPSIPRPHFGNANLSIRSQTTSGPQPDSPQSRPPSGQRAGRSATRSGRARARVFQGTHSTRNRSGSRTRTQQPEFSPNSNLYVGNEGSELLTSENTLTRVHSDQSSSRRPSITSHRFQNAPRDNSPSNDYDVAGRSVGFTRQPVAGSNGDMINSAVDLVAAQNLADLHIGNDPLPLTHGSSGRLRHGHIASAGAIEQAQALGSPGNSRRSSAQSLPGSPGHSLTKNSLYIGADPVSTEGCLRNFLLNSIAQKHSSNSSATKKPKKTSREPSQDLEHHWGQVREMRGQGNDIVLSGTAVQAQDADS